MTDTVALTLEDIYGLARSSLMAAGCDDANAEAVARNMTAAERDGCVSHGLFRLPAHLASLRNGKVNGRARPAEETLTPAAIRLDGDRGYAPMAHEYGIPLLADAARSSGVAVLLIRNSFHYAALWPEVEAIAEHDLVGLACTVNVPFVAPFGGSQPFFSTNPLAFAYPRPGSNPYVVDMATSARAHGEIGVAARDGRTVPEGAGLDSSGQPTTDPQAILDGGVLLPFGGYKGSAVATMVELMAAGLVGDYFSFKVLENDNRDGGPAVGGQFLMAFSPELLAGPDWAAHSDVFLTRLDAIDGVRLPGSRRFAARADGGPRHINADLIERLRADL